MVSLITVNNAQLISRHHVSETIISCQGRLFIHLPDLNLNNGTHA